MNLFTKRNNAIIDSVELRNSTALKQSSGINFNNAKALQSVLNYSVTDFQNGKFKYPQPDFGILCNKNSSLPRHRKWHHPGIEKIPEH